MGEAAEVAKEDVVVNVEKHNEGVEFPSLFGEGVSEAELKGETTGDETADPEPTGETEKKEGEESPGDETADKEGEAAKEPEKAPEKAEVTPDKPPPGFVPLAAVQQERRKAQSLSAENASLKAEIAKRNTAPADDAKFEEFKVKTTEEYRELLEKDPDAANMYQYEYTQYLQHKDAADKEKEAASRATESERSIVAEGSAEIERLLPGFHDNSNPEVKVIADFAVETGFDPDILFDMTNPQTKIVSSKGESYILGTGAAQLIKMIKAAHAVPDAEAIKKKIEDELRPEIEAEVQATLVKKLKSGKDFKSLDNATSSSSKEFKPVTGVLSEAEFAAKSKDEQRELLGG